MAHTSRRDLITSATALGFSTSMLGLSSAPARAAEDLDDPKHRMTSIMKLYGSTDDRVNFGFVNGIYYGLIDRTLTPMFGVLAGVFTRFTARPDGTYDGATFEIAYFTDPVTGQKLENYTNPITGETVGAAPVTRSGPHPLHITPDTAERVHVPGLAREVKQKFRPLRIVRDRVWLIEELNVRINTPGAPSTGNASVTSYGGSVADVLNPKLKVVPAEVNYTATTPWRPWIKMGDRPGSMLCHATGRTIQSIDDFPPYYLELTKKLHADVLEDPMALMKSVKRPA